MFVIKVCHLNAFYMLFGIWYKYVGHISAQLDNDGSYFAMTAKNQHCNSLIQPIYGPNLFRYSQTGIFL